MFNVFIAYLCVPMLSILFSMHVFRFRFIDIHVFTWFGIYYRSFNFFYVTYHCLYPHVWTTSLDHAHVWLPEHATLLYHMYSRVASYNPDSHVQILESEPWWSCCSWTECAADPPVAIRVAQQKLGHHRSSPSQLFSWLALETPLAAREHLSAFDYFIFCISYLYSLVM